MPPKTTPTMTQKRPQNWLQKRHQKWSQNWFQKRPQNWLQQITRQWMEIRIRIDLKISTNSTSKSGPKMNPKNGSKKTSKSHQKYNHIVAHFTPYGVEGLPLADVGPVLRTRVSLGPDFVVHFWRHFFKSPFHPTIQSIFWYANRDLNLVFIGSQLCGCILDPNFWAQF